MNAALTDTREQTKHGLIIKRQLDSYYIRRDKRFDKGTSHYFPAKYSDQRTDGDLNASNIKYR
jgi:hypothetical protein